MGDGRGAPWPDAPPAGHSLRTSTAPRAPPRSPAGQTATPLGFNCVCQTTAAVTDSHRRVAEDPAPAMAKVHVAGHRHRPR